MIDYVGMAVFGIDKDPLPSVNVNTRELTIDACGSCQLKCPGCFTTSKGSDPLAGLGYLKFENLKGIIDDNRQIKKVFFVNRGEMFLNPDLLKIMEYCFEKGVEMHSDSGVNLNFVREGILEGLVKYGFKSLLCSIDGASQETYKEYRVGGNFDTVIDNIKEINRFKKKYNTDYPELTWQFIIFGHNEDEIPIAREMARKLDMAFITKLSWNPDLSPIKDRELIEKETGRSELSRGEVLEGSGRHYMRGICYTLWSGPCINWDGRLLGCCWSDKVDFGGNVFRDGFINVVHGEMISNARDTLMGRSSPMEGLPCTTCELYRCIEEKGDYLTEDEIYRKGPLLNRTVRFLYENVPGLRRFRRVVGNLTGGRI